MKAKLDVNLIGVEWQRLQLRNSKIDIYNCTKLFGSVVGKLLEAMIKSFGLNLDNLVMVGHSIAGGFCAEVGTAVGNKAAAIIGLESCSYKDRAKFVQVCIANIVKNYSDVLLLSFHFSSSCDDYFNLQCFVREIVVHAVISVFVTYEICIYICIYTKKNILVSLKRRQIFSES